MRIFIYGAAQTVTGSRYLIEVNGQRLLLECGLFQGHRVDTYTRNLNFQFVPKELDAVILSHAHIDHSGNLPNLVKQGYNRPIHVTPATADLADIMLRDSGHIQEADVTFVNKRRARQGLPAVEPLYTEADAEQVAPLFTMHDYDQAYEPIAGVTARLVDAGHILGSAAIELELRENGKRVKLWFSGDIGRRNMPLVRDPVLPSEVDYLLMECTYGDRSHAEPETAFNRFHEVVKRTAQRGGKIIVPAFAVGRTQELVYFLNQLTSEGIIRNIPVYVDSPLAVNATEVYERHPECLDAETHQFVREHRHPALEFKNLTYTQSVDESKAINDRRGPMVIISASGMAENGRILHHLRNNIEDARNTIVIVSWQSPDTLGRRLVEGAKQVKIFGEEFTRRAEVVAINGLSAHAGQDMLLRYALANNGRTRKIILVHGEARAARSFQEKLAAAGGPPTIYPEQNMVIDL